MNTESGAIRAFVAIDVPAPVITHLIEIRRELTALLPSQSMVWTKPENMHLTLRFLGNVAPEDIGELKRRLRTALVGFGELDLLCERLGYFPHLQYVRVLWVWVHDTTERLQELHQRIDEAVRDFAEKPEEAQFVGHITLARPKRIERRNTERLVRFVEGAANRNFGNWQAREVILRRSELSRGGANYSELGRFTFS